MKKCKHLNLNTKFLRTKRYNKDILIEYTYCEKCGEVFKGNVSFIKPIEKEVAKINIVIEDTDNNCARVAENEIEEVTRPKVKIKKVVGVPSDKPKVKRDVVQAPKGTTLGNILKAKYNVEEKVVEPKKATKQKTTSNKKASKSKFTPMDVDSFDDIDIFLK